MLHPERNHVQAAIVDPLFSAKFSLRMNQDQRAAPRAGGAGERSSLLFYCLSR